MFIRSSLTNSMAKQRTIVIWHSEADKCEKSLPLVVELGTYIRHGGTYFQLS